MIRIPTSTPTASALPLCAANHSEEKRLAASLAHNVNNVLTGVIGNLELALRVAPPGSAVSDGVNRGLQGAHQVADLIRRIVGFALRKPPTSDRQRVSLRRLALASAGRAEPVAAKQGVKITVAGAGAGWVLGDSRLLLNVLEQLVTNSLEELPEGGQITLCTWDESGHGFLSISDNGPGFAGEALERLFQPFFTTKRCGHLGLGLVLCKESVEAHGGSIQIASESGGGVQVTLAIPLAEVQARSEPETESNIQKQEARVGYTGPHVPALGVLEARNMARL